VVVWFYLCCLFLVSDHAAVFSRIKPSKENYVPHGSSQFILLKRTSNGEAELTRPKELSVETTAPDASKTLTYWLRTVNDYIDYLGEGRAEDAPAINREDID